MDGMGSDGWKQLDVGKGTVARMGQEIAPASDMVGAAASLAGSAQAGPAASDGETPSVLPLWRDPLAPWITVNHAPHLGAKARLALRRAGFEVHWPREVVRRSRCDDTLRPYFEGYLFALPLTPDVSWRDAVEEKPIILGVVGVREFGRPSPSPAGLVLGLIERAGGALDGVMPAKEDEVSQEIWAKRYAKGAPVKVTAGPWAEVDAVIQADRGKRVDVLLTLLGVTRVVTVARSRLVAGSAASKVDPS
jgi:transcription antitermination factor NusG